MYNTTLKFYLVEWTIESESIENFTLYTFMLSRILNQYCGLDCQIFREKMIK